MRGFSPKPHTLITEFHSVRKFDGFNLKRCLVFRILHFPEHVRGNIDTAKVAKTSTETWPKQMLFYCHTIYNKLNFGNNENYYHLAS